MLNLLDMPGSESRSTLTLYVGCDGVTTGYSMTKAGCSAKTQLEMVQQFPTNGPLADNIGVPLAILGAQVGKLSTRAYSYVLSSVKLDSESASFVQHGSAPNFQGNVLTLCTCKHQMRATQKVEQWRNMWLAGFTSRTLLDGRHWLFYLARIENAYESQADIWKALESKARRAKAADSNYLGDVFRPKALPLAGKDRFTPHKYVEPAIHAHRKDRSDQGWKKDINYKHARMLRHPPLLKADPQFTFLWDEPHIYLDNNHCRDFAKWSRLKDLFKHLREVK